MRESVDVVFQNQTFHIFHYKYADGPKKRAATKLQKENGLGLSRLTRNCGAPVVEESSASYFSQTKRNTVKGHKHKSRFENPALKASTSMKNKMYLLWK